ncbi:MAG: hypothetical protein LC799_06910 [Actinobacteria bacterium]|nr:hypothetical protein [Actinomycetota bacterium]
MTIQTLDGGRARRARVVVRDHGRWRPIPADLQGRGRGIRPMTRFMDIVTNYRGDHEDDRGTEVILVSRRLSPGLTTRRV